MFFFWMKFQMFGCVVDRLEDYYVPDESAWLNELLGTSYSILTESKETMRAMFNFFDMI